MLQPKRVKYRNQHRGRRKGMAVAGSTINFGEYAIKATESAWVTSRQIEAARRAMTRYARRGGRIWIRIFPDKSVTARAAEPARVALGERDIPITYTEELREYNKGVFEGLTEAEYREKYPELYEPSLVNDLDFAPPNGETIRETSGRLAGIVQRVKQAHLDESALIVGHGGSLRASIVSLLELPLEANWKFAMHNCSLTVIYTFPDNAVMHLYNDTSHISGVVRAWER